MFNFKVTYKGVNITINDKCKTNGEMRTLHALRLEGCKSWGEATFPRITIKKV